MKINIIALFFLLIAVSAWGKWIEVSNTYIKIGADYDTGRLTLATMEGDVSISFDNYKDLLYAKTPPTSITTLSLNGEYYIFGSDNGSFTKRPYAEGNKITAEWTVRDVAVIQEASIVKGISTGLEDTMLVSYKIVNKSGRTIKAGLRVILDTVLDDVEPKVFSIPGVGNISQETLFSKNSIPAYWYSFDDYSNPILRVVGTLSGEGLVKPDRIIFASWDRFYDNKWDFSIDSSRDFRRQGTAQIDSAAALYYDPVDKARDETRQIKFMYGVYGTSVFTSDDMSLSLSVPMEVKGPPVSVSADFNNHSKTALDRLQIEIMPPEGFNLAKDQTNIINYVKVDGGDSKKILWSLTGNNQGGTYTVRVRATGWINEISQKIEVEKDFNIITMKTNVKQTAAVNKPVVNVETPEVPEVTQGSLPETVLLKTGPEMSEQERKLLLEISDLDDLIKEITIKYDVLMGVYKNLYTTNNSFYMDIDGNIKNYEQKLEEEEKILSDEISSLRD